MSAVKLELILERGQKGGLWGRVEYKKNLIAESAENTEKLEESLKNLLYEFEGLDPDSIVFEYKYDVFALFEQFSFLKASSIATIAGINPSLLRQYISGAKHPSFHQAKKIEDALHKLADQMKNARIFA